MSLRDQIVALLAAQAGMNLGDLREAMTAMGLAVGKNEPSATVLQLLAQGRVRREGERGAYRYFAVEGVPAPPRAKGLAPGRKRPASELPAHSSAAIPPAKPTVDRLAPAADIVRKECAQTVLGHLRDNASGWHSVEDIAAQLDEDRQPVALAVAELMRAGDVHRKADASGRWVYQLKPQAKQPAAAAESAVLPRPAVPAAAPEVQAADAEALNRLAVALQEPVSLDHAIALEMTALDDILGLACDQKVPHVAIKALVVAQGSLRRVQQVLRAAQ